MHARALMLQGTGSDAGKSVLVAGLCRLFHKRGLRVRPFKPQNMSNNAAIAADGGEIGRAQALQARACGVPPSVHMNPVLLKPQSTAGAQIVVQGRAIGNSKAREFQGFKPQLLPAVLESFAKLRAEADLVLVEGAGSASEVNLRKNDIANMGFARAARVPVILVGDIDRGGVIASLIGTKTVIDADDAALIRGFVVNKMRGDPSLFSDGMRLIEERTGWRALGLVPYFPEAGALPAEDAYGLGQRGPIRAHAKIRIAVPLTPMIANFDDLDPLRLEPDIDLVMVRAGEHFPWPCRLIVLPGSKATIDDLAFFRGQGWDEDLKIHLRRGGRVLGICGGYQMLGKRISDPDGIEGESCSVEGLCLLDVETKLTATKMLREIGGHALAKGVSLRGYEIHAGVTTGPDTVRPFARLDDGRFDGAISANGHIVGTYLHGLFTDDRQRQCWLDLLGSISSGFVYDGKIEDTLDLLAGHLRRHVDIEALLAMAE